MNFGNQPSENQQRKSLNVHERFWISYFKKILMPNVRTQRPPSQKKYPFKFFFFGAAVISITAHEGFIHGVLEAIGRQEIPVPTGGKKNP